MALTPQNDEAFLREVDEELRREQMGTFWRRYGRLMAIAVFAALAAFGGWLWWQDHREKVAGLDGEALTTAFKALGNGDDKAAKPALERLARGDSAGYRAAAKLSLAAERLQKEDVKGAVALYAEVSADPKIPQPFRDLALIRQTAAEFDTLKPEVVIARMKPLAIAGQPWFGSAGEMTAISLIRQGQEEKAGAVFAALATDKQVPDSIRGRARRIAGALGADVAADEAASGKELVQ